MDTNFIQKRKEEAQVLRETYKKATHGHPGKQEVRDAIAAFSSGMFRWLQECCSVLLTEKQLGLDPKTESFEIIALASFARGEAAPYSDMDITALCATEKVSDKITPFLNKLFYQPLAQLNLNADGTGGFTTDEVTGRGSHSVESFVNSFQSSQYNLNHVYTFGADGPQSRALLDAVHHGLLTSQPLKEASKSLLSKGLDPPSPITVYVPFITGKKRGKEVEEWDLKQVATLYTRYGGLLSLYQPSLHAALLTSERLKVVGVQGLVDGYEELVLFRIHHQFESESKAEPAVNTVAKGMGDKWKQFEELRERLRPSLEAFNQWLIDKKFE